MQLVLAGGVGNEAKTRVVVSREPDVSLGYLLVLFTTQLAHHIPQREDRSKNQLSIIISRFHRLPEPCWRGSRGLVGLAHDGCRAREPAALVDAFSWRESVRILIGHGACTYRGGRRCRKNRRSWWAMDDTREIVDPKMFRGVGRAVNPVYR